MVTVGKKDLEYLKWTFGQFNEKYFGGRLTEPVFKFYTGKDIYGRCVVGSRNGKIPTEIWISKYAHEDTFELDDTILHEMIHQFIYEVLHFPKRRVVTHGIEFHLVRLYLKFKHGVNIKKPGSIF